MRGLKENGDVPRLIMSPSSSFRWSGIPWQMTSFMDLEFRDLVSIYKLSACAV